MVSFLILHYNEIELTERAIESIVKMQGERCIVVVDNASSNGSGSELVKRYCNSERSIEAELTGADNDWCANFCQAENLTVHCGSLGDNCECKIYIILNETNGGFSKGNNIGYRFIKGISALAQSDFLLALNNDISFPQEDFINRLFKVYDESNPKFYLAGPDVYTPHIRSHISPLSKLVRGADDIHETMRINEERIAQFSGGKSFASYTRYLQDKYQGTKLLALYNRIRSGEYDGACRHDESLYDCVLNGACLIFDKRYIAKYDVLFEEYTFLYAEEDFLAYRLKKANEASRYCPELVVDHVGQGSSGYSKMNYKQYCEKNIRTLKTVNEAYEKYIEYIGGCEK